MQSYLFPNVGGLVGLGDRMHSSIQSVYQELNRCSVYLLDHVGRRHERADVQQVDHTAEVQTSEQQILTIFGPMHLEHLHEKLNEILSLLPLERGGPRFIFRPDHLHRDHLDFCEPPLPIPPIVFRNFVPKPYQTELVRRRAPYVLRKQ